MISKNLYYGKLPTQTRKVTTVQSMKIVTQMQKYLCTNHGPRRKMRREKLKPGKEASLCKGDVTKDPRLEGDLNDCGFTATACRPVAWHAVASGTVKGLA